MVKRNVLVIYEDSREELATVARSLKTAFGDVGYSVKVRMASEASIPEVLAASVLVIGAATSAQESFAELKRFLSGVNLAGRHAAVFIGGEMTACAAIESMLHDTEITVYADALSVKTGDVSAWFKGLSQTLANQDFQL